MVLLQQPLLNVLLLQLIDLRRRHLSAIRSEIAIGLGADCDDFLVGSSSKEHGEKLFFENGQTSLEVLESRRILSSLIRELAQRLCGFNQESRERALRDAGGG